MEFRTGLVKGPKKLEYGSIKKVEVAASTFLSNSLVSVCFLLHFIQSRHFCDNLSSQPVGNFPSFRNVQAASARHFYFSTVDGSKLLLSGESVRLCAFTVIR